MYVLSNTSMQFIFQATLPCNVPLKGGTRDEQHPPPFFY